MKKVLLTLTLLLSTAILHASQSTNIIMCRGAGYLVIEKLPVDWENITVDIPISVGVEVPRTISLKLDTGETKTLTGYTQPVIKMNAHVISGKLESLTVASVKNGTITRMESSVNGFDHVLSGEISSNNASYSEELGQYSEVAAFNLSCGLLYNNL